MKWGGLLLLGLLTSLWTAQWARAQPTPVDTLLFKGYPEAPAFSVAPSGKELEFYPCTMCHDSMEPDSRIRTLEASHEIELKHGQGRMWCLNCHDETQRDFLRTQLGEKLEFERENQVCGGCHANRHKDWAFGGHGKRLGNWQGKRVIHTCSHCHDPHNPAISPRKPMPAPLVRAGLKPALIHPRASTRLWQKYAPSASQEHPVDGHR